MPVHSIDDLLEDPPRPIAAGFELAARRITATWLETREVVATPDDLRLATQFLKPLGVTIEPLCGCEVRLTSQSGLATIMSREDAILTALRSLVALETRRLPRSIARAA